MQLMEAKVRPVGNSLGFILPAKVVKAAKIRNGQLIHYALLEPKQLSLDGIVGKYPELKGFDRNLTGRD